MSKSSNRSFLRVLADLFILMLLFNAHWYITVLAIIMATIIFFPYFEVVVFSSIIDAYYGTPTHYLYTVIAIGYFIVIYIIRGRILFNSNYVPISKKKI